MGQWGVGAGIGAGTWGHGLFVWDMDPIITCTSDSPKKAGKIGFTTEKMLPDLVFHLAFLEKLSYRFWKFAELFRFQVVRDHIALYKSGEQWAVAVG